MACAWSRWLPEHRAHPMRPDSRGVVMPQGVTRELVAARAARELRDGMYVNLGIGLPTLVSNFAPAGVILQAECGVLGYGRIAGDDERDPDLINAGGQYVVLNPGGAYF